jgi:hypothetical protein
MPLKVYFTKSWTFSEVFGTTSYVRQWFEDLFNIKIQESFERLPIGHAAEAVDMTDTFDREWEQAFSPSAKPPLRVYFVEMLIMKKFSLRSVTTAEPGDFGGISFKKKNVAVLDREALVGRFGRHNSLEFARTMGHEVAHLLSLEHLRRGQVSPNLLSSVGTVGKRPRFAVQDWQVRKAREYGLSRRYLLR